MQNLKRVLSLLVALAMCLSLMSVSVFAADDEGEDETAAIEATVDAEESTEDEQEAAPVEAASDEDEEEAAVEEQAAEAEEESEEEAAPDAEDEALPEEDAEAEEDADADAEAEEDAEAEADEIELPGATIVAAPTGEELAAEAEAARIAAEEEAARLEAERLEAERLEAEKAAAEAARLAAEKRWPKSEKTLVFDTENYTVTVTVPESAFAEPVYFRVIEMQWAELDDATRELLLASGLTEDDALLDIGFEDGDGFEVEPDAAIGVTIEAAEAEIAEVYHVEDAETVAKVAEDVEDVAEFVVDGFSVFVVKSGTSYSVNTIAAQDGTITRYETLEAAFAAAADGDTIVLTADCEGNGIIATQNMFGTNGLTVDFNNHTYKVNGTTLAGSTGTKTQAFQLLKGNKITFKNGTIVGDNTNVKMLIQNYSDLTLDSMRLDATQGNNGVGYVLSTNNGNTTIKDSTITAKTGNGKYAFDVCTGWGDYTSNVVSVSGSSKITGNMEVSFYGNGTPSVLNISGGAFEGSIIPDNNHEGDRCTVSITGGTFSTDPTAYLATDCKAIAVTNNDVTSYIVVKEGGTITDANRAAFVASIGSKGYTTLDAAVAAVPTDGTATTINLLKTFTGELHSIAHGKNITINADKNTFTMTYAPGVRGDLTLANGTFKIVNDSIYVYGSANDDGNAPYSKLTVASDAKLHSDQWAIVMWHGGDGKCYDALVDVYGTVEGNIFVSGNITSGDSVINIYEGATVTTDVDGVNYAQAIAGNGFATINITGGTITGSKTGVEARAGALNISGSPMITGYGTETTVTPNKSGTTTIGAGVAVAQHTTKLQMDVSISGTPVITGKTGLIIANPQENETTNMNVSVSGGTFNGGIDAEYSSATGKAVENRDGRVSKFITGGTFSSEPNASYIADGRSVGTLSDGRYIVGTKDHFAAVAPTYSASGNYEYWRIGGRYFSDEACTTETTLSALTRAQLVYVDSGDDYTPVTTPTQQNNDTLETIEDIATPLSNTNSVATNTETTENADGSTTTTTDYLDGSKSEVTSKTTANADGSKTTTSTGTLTDANGDKTEVTQETTTKTNSDGSTTAKTTSTETKSDGTKTETKSETVTATDGSSKATSTEVATAADGKVTTTETETVTTAAGDVKETKGVTDATGSKGTTVTENGVTTSAEATITAAAVTEAKASNEAVTLPVTVAAAESTSEAATVSVTLPEATTGTTKVEVPVTEVKASTVAYVKNASGELELLKDCVVTENGVALGVEGNKAEIVIVDNAKDFNDVSSDSWANDAVQFVASREIFNGVSESSFAPQTEMSRGMLAQVLFNFDRESKATGETAFNDASGKWYDDAAGWASSLGVINGDNGKFKGDNSVSRQDLATMLYRYAEAKGYKTDGGTALSGFGDADSVDGYAAKAMQWAVGNGLIGGTDKGLEPKAGATREMVAAIMMRFCAKIK